MNNFNDKHFDNSVYHEPLEDRDAYKDKLILRMTEWINDRRNSNFCDENEWCAEDGCNDCVIRHFEQLIKDEEEKI